MMARDRPCSVSSCLCTVQVLSPGRFPLPSPLSPYPSPAPPSFLLKKKERNPLIRHKEIHQLRPHILPIRTLHLHPFPTHRNQFLAPIPSSPPSFSCAGGERTPTLKIQTPMLEIHIPNRRKLVLSRHHHHRLTVRSRGKDGGQRSGETE